MCAVADTTCLGSEHSIVTSTRYGSDSSIIPHGSVQTEPLDAIGQHTELVNNNLENGLHVVPCFFLRVDWALCIATQLTACRAPHLFLQQGDISLACQLSNMSPGRNRKTHVLNTPDTHATSISIRNHLVLTEYTLSHTVWRRRRDKDILHLFYYRPVRCLLSAASSQRHIWYA